MVSMITRAVDLIRIVQDDLSPTVSFGGAQRRPTSGQASAIVPGKVTSLLSFLMSVFFVLFLVISLRIAEEKTEGDPAELVPTDTRTTLFLYCPSSFPIVSSRIMKVSSTSNNLGVGRAH